MVVSSREVPIPLYICGGLSYNTCERAGVRSRGWFPLDDGGHAGGRRREEGDRGGGTVEAQEKGLAEVRARRLEELERLVEELEAQLRSTRAESEGSHLPLPSCAGIVLPGFFLAQPFHFVGQIFGWRRVRCAAPSRPWRRSF